MKLSFAVVCLLFLGFPSVFAQPNKIWATYYGDGSIALGTETSTVVYDQAGFVYVAGVTHDSTINLATPGSFKEHMSGFSDAYLAKFDTLGNRIWATYIGNEDGDLQPRLHLDRNGNVLVAGVTQGQQNLMGTAGTYQPEIPGPPGSNINASYLLKFNSNGQRLWGTYLDYWDPQSTTTFRRPASITSNSQGEIAIGGTASGDYPFPSANTYMPVPQDLENGFVLKLDASGNFLWGTYFGGDEADDVVSVSCDAVGNIYFSGLTQSVAGIASSGAFYPVFSSSMPSPNNFEGYIGKLAPNGSLQWATYTNGILGTGGVTATGDGCYLAGVTTRDTGIATPGTYLHQYGDSTDYTLTRWDINGQKVWGTYYGGAGLEYHYGVDVSGGTHVGAAFRTNNLALDAAGNIMIVGGTYSMDNIKVGCTYSGWKEGVPQGNGFMAKFYPDGNIMWGSYFDIPTMSIACASEGSSFYMVTKADLDSLTTPGAFQETKTPGTFAGYLVKMTGDYTCPDLVVALDYTDGVLRTDSGYNHYQWFRNNEPVAGAEGYTYIPSDSGTYYVRYKNSCDCVHTSDTVRISGGTALSALDSRALKVTTYPNPNQGTFTVLIESPKGFSELDYTLIDFFGRPVHKGSVNATTRLFKQELHFPDLSSGAYVLEVTVDGRKMTRKISVYK